MSTHNMCFYEELEKNYPQICTPPKQFLCKYSVNLSRFLLRVNESQIRTNLPYLPKVLANHNSLLCLFSDLWELDPVERLSAIFFYKKGTLRKHAYSNI